MEQLIQKAKVSGRGAPSTEPELTLDSRNFKCAALRQLLPAGVEKWSVDSPSVVVGGGGRGGG